MNPYFDEEAYLREWVRLIIKDLQMNQKPRFRKCPACSCEVEQRSGLFHCVCGWTPKELEYYGAPFNHGARYQPYDRQVPEPVDLYMRKRT